MSATDWCFNGLHDQCPREYQRFVVEKGTLVWLKEKRVCECPKRGCKCYVKKADRAKPKRKAKK